MISASSSSTLRAARKLIVEPLICLENYRTRVAPLDPQRPRSYHTEGPTSDRRLPQPVGTTTRLKPRKSSSSQGSGIEPKSLNGGSESPKRLLDPYTLSRRLTDLAQKGQLNEAVTMLQNSPLDASNVKTWNTLLLQCMREERFKLGYKIFADMKRRGFKPNVRTFTTLFAGFSTIRDWEAHSVQFKNARALWGYFLERIEQLKAIDPNHRQINTDPAGCYISILAANGKYNAMFDVLNDLDQEGQFSPTEFVYARLFQAIAYRTQLAPGDKEKVAYRNASDVRLVWKDFTKRAAKDPKLMTDRVILYFLKALTKGRPADQLYAFDFIRDHFGLSKPGEKAPPRQVELAPMTLDAVLSLCLATQKYRLCIHYVQQLIDEAIAKNTKCIVDRGHMDKVLKSYAEMTVTGSAGEPDRVVKTIEWMHQYYALGWNVGPMASTYGCGLMTCWRGGDWRNAARIVELMTGCHAEDFVDGSPNLTSPRLDNRSQDRTFVPDSRDMSCLLRAALASGEVANMRQCLRMASFFGNQRSSGEAESIDVYLAHDHHPQNLANTTATKQEGSFYATKVVSALVEVLERVLKGRNVAKDTPEMKEWRKFREKAKKILQESTKLEPPISELHPLGSARGLEATDRLVDYDLATRSSKPGRTMRT